jgi:ubiquinone/menaquinone biosynthesis C-methylase UbiE
MIKPHLPRDATAPCADLGTGTGKWGLKLLKSGYPTTFVDHSANMVNQVREKLESNPRQRKATLHVADIIAMPELPSDHFGLALAMGDPLSICTDPPAAAREIFRIMRPGGVVIATADNKLAAIEHYMEKGNVEAIEGFLKTGRTRWLTPDEQERFELTTFTPGTLRRMFERAGFEVIEVVGKTVLPIRKHKEILSNFSTLQKLLELEQELARDPSTAAAAAHLQITARKPAA